MATPPTSRTPPTPPTSRTPLMQGSAGDKQDSTATKIKKFLSKPENLLFIGSTALLLGALVSFCVGVSVPKASNFCAILTPTLAVPGVMGFAGLLFYNDYQKIND